MMKANGVLFGVNSSGKIFQLGLDHHEWRELPYLGIEFKRISASKNSLWAIGGDHQIYVRLFGVEVPIRVKEETYENQRWNPMSGFSNKLLPTDRPQFSTIDGLAEKTKESIHLPTMAWQWESLWYVDTQYNGATLEKEGWTYAVDFPAEYYSKKTFTSCVRRRKWIRYRKYISTDSWSVVPPIHKDLSEEPFIDVSVGGTEIPNGNPDESFVWAVTVLGKIYVRQGVRSYCPEGNGWLHITTPERCEVSQVSVGPTGMTWAITWHGKALVRLSVTRLDPTGVSWAIVDEPGPDSPLSQVSVGENAVWALTRDRKVWFRNGIHGGGAGESDVLAKGTKWIEMVGQLQMICLGVGDQVFSIGCNDEDDDDHSDFYATDKFCIVWRTGINHSDLSGKTWKKVTSPVVENFQDDPRFDRAEPIQITSAGDSASNEVSRALPPNLESNVKVEQGSSNLNFKRFGDNLAKDVLATTVGTMAGATIGRIPIVGGPLTMATRELVRQELKDVHIFDEKSDGPEDKNLPEVSKPVPIDESMYQSAITGEEVMMISEAVARTKFETSSDVASEGDRMSIMSGMAGFDREDRYSGYDEGVNNLPHWMWIAAGSCRIDPSQPPPGWFSTPDIVSSQLSLAGEPWRVNILQSLRDQNSTMSSEQFKNFEAAVERASWVRKGTAKVIFGGKGSPGWENCTVELEQTGTNQNEVDFGTLSIFGTSKKIKEHISLSEITSVIQYADKTLAIFTPLRSHHLQPIQLKFAGDLDLEAWQAHILKGINCLRLTQSSPSPNCMFSVTSRGEVCVFDPIAAERSGAMGDVQRTQNDVKYSQEINIPSVPFIFPLLNGFGAGSQLLFIVKIQDNAERFSINLQTGKMSAESDIALHFNPRIDDNKVVLNDRRSGAWGLEEYQPMIVMQEDGAFKAFNQGHSVQILIQAELPYFQVFVNGVPFCRFNHRCKPEEITHFRIHGDIEPQSATYHSISVILPPTDMYWRVLGGGHLLQVESCSAGVTWALGYDSTPWVYTGGWGGSHFKGIETSNFGINWMEDTKYYYVYENQRWNPLTGFTAHGLPTDRYSWSDRTGRLNITRETVKPPSIHWQWVTDWMVDFHTPGGVDKEGWQYATDFPVSYHGKMCFTDYVRRRRWARKCKLATSGPWKQLCSTKLVDISIQTVHNDDKVHVWVVSSNGDALYRRGVTSRCPEGQEWIQVPSDVQFQAITIGGNGSDNGCFKVWAVGKDGSVYLRHGITNVAPIGQIWLQVHAPSNQAPIRSLDAGDPSVLWAIDVNNKLYLRREITSVFPEGTAWTPIPIVSTCSHFTGGEIRSVSVCGKEVWAVLDNITIVPTSSAIGAVGGAAAAAAAVVNSAAAAATIAYTTGTSQPANGVLVRMCGITPSNPAGTGWEIATGGGWRHICIRGKKVRTNN